MAARKQKDVRKMQSDAAARARRRRSFQISLGPFPSPSPPPSPQSGYSTSHLVNLSWNRIHNYIVPSCARNTMYVMQLITKAQTEGIKAY